MSSRDIYSGYDTKACWFTSNRLENEINRPRYAPLLLLYHLFSSFLLSTNDGRVKISSDLGSPVYDTSHYLLLCLSTSLRKR
jgi:hypothetical protein